MYCAIVRHWRFFHVQELQIMKMVSLLCFLFLSFEKDACYLVESLESLESFGINYLYLPRPNSLDMGLGLWNSLRKPGELHENA